MSGTKFDALLGSLRTADFTPETVTKVVATTSSGFVADYYATGTADDVPIQAALTAIHALGGGRVYVREGTYTLSATLTIYSNTTLELSDDAVIILSNSVATNLLTNYAATPVVTANDAAMTSGSPALTSASVPSMTVGQQVIVFGAGTSGGSYATLVSTILSIVGTTATLADNAVNTVTNAKVEQTVRDNDITLKGGWWKRGTSNGSGFSAINILLGRIDRLHIEHIKFSAPNGNRSINLRNLTDSLIEDVDFVSAWSSGLQINGPLNRVTFKNIRGTTGDDLLAIVPLDWPTWVWGDEGNVTDLTIENVTGVQSGTSIVKVLGGTGITVDRVQIRNVQGYGGNSINTSPGYTELSDAVYLGDDPGNANTFGGYLTGIIVDGVTVSVPNESNIVCLSHGNTPVPYTNTSDVRFGDVVISNINFNCDLRSVVSIAAICNRVSISNVNGSTATAAFFSGGVYLNDIVNAGVIGTLSLSNINISTAVTNGGHLLVARSPASPLTYVSLSNINLNNMSTLFDVDTTATIEGGNIRIANNTNSFTLRKSANVTLSLNNITQAIDTPNFLVSLRSDTVTNTSGSSTITDASILTADGGTGGNASGRLVTGTGVPANSYVGAVVNGVSFTLVDAYGNSVVTTSNVTAIDVGAQFNTKSLSTRTALSRITAPVQGDTIYNYQSATGPGVGPAMYNGTLWQLAGSPMAHLGDMEYGNSGGYVARFGGNTTTTKKFLNQTGDGVNSAQPAWGTIATSDLPTIPVAGGGTGQTTYTDGQLLIGDSSTNGLDKATITAGTAISVTNGHGSITIANTGATSITGTSNQITASASTGAITLSTPQNIDTAASVNFDNLTLTHTASGSEFTALTVKNSGTAGASDVSILFNVANLSTSRAKIRAVAPGSSKTELAFYTSSGNTTPVEKFRIDGPGNVRVGTAAIATNATDGFLYIPTCAGAPTGTPTSITGLVPMVYDTTNNNFYIYNGAWKKTTTFA